MTNVNGSTLPSQLALNPEGSSNASIGSIISSLANATPSTISKFADSAFTSMSSKDQVKFLPFLTSLVRAFQNKDASSSGGAQGAGAAGGAGAPVDIAAATKSLINARNDMGSVKGLDSAISKISDALPNLTQGQFDGLMDSLKAASASKPGTGGTAGTAEIDSTELSLIGSQIGADVASNKSAQASPTGNAALDAVLGAIKSASSGASSTGGASSDDTAALAQILASLSQALMPSDPSGSLMQALGGALGLPAGQGQSSGGGGQLMIEIGMGGGGAGVGGMSGFGGSSGSGGMGAAQGFYGGAGAYGARGSTFDGMSFLRQEMQQSAALSNYDPSSVNGAAYSYLLTALQDSANRSTVGTGSAGMNATTM